MLFISIFSSGYGHCRCDPEGHSCLENLCEVLHYIVNMHTDMYFMCNMNNYTRLLLVVAVSSLSCGPHATSSGKRVGFTRGAFTPTEAAHTDAQVNTGAVSLKTALPSSLGV